MPALELTIQERKAHRADAHHLNPVVIIGGDGLTAGVQKEVDAALNAHGLIKVRVTGDDRAAREAVYAKLCDELGCAPIQHIGKLLILWRPMPEKAKAERDEDRLRAPRDVKFAKAKAQAAVWSAPCAFWATNASPEAAWSNGRSRK
jgi:RNA-binding protein